LQRIKHLTELKSQAGAVTSENVDNRCNLLTNVQIARRIRDWTPRNTALSGADDR
jgi:hypothetical protein